MLQLELKNIRVDELEKIINTSYYKHLHYLKSLINVVVELRGYEVVAVAL